MSTLHDICNSSIVLLITFDDTCCDVIITSSQYSTYTGTHYNLTFRISTTTIVLQAVAVEDNFNASDRKKWKK